LAATGTEAHRAELAGMLVDPGARLAVEARDLSGIDERLGSAGRQAAQPGGESLGEQVGESVRRIVLVGGRLEDGCGGRSSGGSHPSLRDEVLDGRARVPRAAGTVSWCAGAIGPGWHDPGVHGLEQVRVLGTA
jgi:hypothetical protein